MSNPAERCRYVPAPDDCLTHDPDLGLYRDEACRFDHGPDLTHEADVLAEAARIIRRHRGGLGTVIAVLEETEQALRNAAEGKQT